MSYCHSLEIRKKKKKKKSFEEEALKVTPVISSAWKFSVDWFQGFLVEHETIAVARFVFIFCIFVQLLTPRITDGSARNGEEIKHSLIYSPQFVYI